MKALSRLLTFGAVVGTGGFLLVAFAEPVPVTSSTTTENPAPKPEQPSDSEFLKKDAEKTETTVTTESTVAETSEPAKSQPTVKRKQRGDGKSVRRHDGKEMKEIIEPIGEGPGDTFGAPDLPLAVAPPEFPGVLQSTPR